MIFVNWLISEIIWQINYSTLNQLTNQPINQLTNQPITLTFDPSIKLEFGSIYPALDSELHILK